MRKTSLRFALLAALALAGMPAIANAVECVGAISLGETNAIQTLPGLAGDPDFYGGGIEIRGVVDCFSDPVLGCTNPNNEYTFVLTGVPSAAPLKTPGVGPGGAWTAYQYHFGTTFTIYEDTTPDADPAVPGSYTDGTVFLSGSMTDVSVNYFLDTATKVWQMGNIDSGSSASFSGGSGLECIGDGCDVLLTGGYNTLPSARPPGYTAHLAAKIDVQCPTAAEPSTMGRVKSIYR